jgi:flagellar basal body-associated protein FliL
MSKKIIYIVLLIIAIAGAVALVFGLNSATEKRDNKTNTINRKVFQVDTFVSLYPYMMIESSGAGFPSIYQQI